MRQRGARWLGQAAATMLPLLAASASPQVAPSPPDTGHHGRRPVVLILDSGDPLRAGAVAFQRGLHGALFEWSAARNVPPPEIFVESADLARLDRAGYLETFAAWVRRRYPAPPAVLVAPNPVAAGLTGRVRREAWSDVPLVARRLGESDGGAWPSRSTGLFAAEDAPGTLRLALALLPGTRRVAFVGEPAASPAWGWEAWRQALGGPLELEDLSGLPMAAIESRVSRLTEGAVVLYTGITADGAGETFRAEDALLHLLPYARVPVFAVHSTMAELGILGGVLFDPERAGWELGGMAAAILEGVRVEAIAPRTANVNVPTVDQRQLRRWGIPEARVPAGVRILHTPPSLWTQYRTELLAGLALGVVLLAAVVILLVERARRGRVTRQLQDVAGRLVGAQEAERGRIARELHDDVIQRLALLAIQLDGHAGPPGSPDDWPRPLGDAVRSLAADLRALGGTLYPARLPHIGVVQALRDLARDMTDHHPIRVTVEQEAFPVHVDDGLGLALYRIAQEALQNAVRHSGAREARVTLRGGPDALSLEITDDGTGMPANAVPGIGLTSMRERAASLGARLSVGRARGGGTRVEVRMPRTPAGVR